MSTVFLLLSKGAALLPYIAALLSPTIWNIVSKALPLVTSLVRAYESDLSLSGRDKAVRVLSESVGLLKKDGYILNESYDWILQVLIELSLVLLRQDSVEKNKQVVIKNIRLV